MRYAETILKSSFELTKSQTLLYSLKTAKITTLIRHHIPMVERNPLKNTFGIRPKLKSNLSHKAKKNEPAIVTTSINAISKALHNTGNFSLKEMRLATIFTSNQKFRGNLKFKIFCPQTPIFMSTNTHYNCIIKTYKNQHLQKLTKPLLCDKI